MDYFQNYYTLPGYYQSIDRGELPIVLGFKADEEDLLRREIMFDIVLFEAIDKNKICERFELDNFDDRFAQELGMLSQFAKDGLIKMDDRYVRVTDEGRFYQRQICRVFDVYDRKYGYAHSREFDDGLKSLDRHIQLAK